MFFIKFGHPTVDLTYRTKPINQEPFYVSPDSVSLTRLAVPTQPFTYAICSPPPSDISKDLDNR